jgi:uncharacterized protein
MIRMATPAERPRIEVMWVVHLMLTLAALYAVLIAGMYFAQTCILFPTLLARIARVQLPESTQRLEVRTAEGESLAGVRILSQRTTADNAATLLGFGGNAWNAEATALSPHALFPHRRVVAFHYPRLCAQQRQPQRAGVFSDSHMIPHHLVQWRSLPRSAPQGAER